MGRKKRYLLILGIVLAAFVAACIFLVLWGRTDESAPDTSDLVVVRMDVPAAENAATYLVKAGELVTAFDDGTRQADYLDWPQDVVDKALADNAAVLELIEKAEACPHLEFAPFDPIWGSPAVPGSFTLMNLYELRASARFRAGQEAEAFDDTLRMMRLGGRIEGSKGGTMPYLVGYAWRQAALLHLRKFLPRSHLDSSHLKELAAAIKAAGPRPEAPADVSRAEYQTQAEYLDNKSRLLPPGSLGPRNWLGQDPLGDYALQVNSTKRKLAEATRAYIATLAMPASEGGRRRQACEEQVQAEKSVYWSLPGQYLPLPNATGRMLYFPFVSVCGQVSRVYTQALAETEMTRTLVALRACRLDKADLPARLNDLVPSYLDTLPADPFDGKPLRYSREKKIVYSVGKDLIDGGGMTEAETREWAKNHSDLAKQFPGYVPPLWDWPDPSLPIEP